MMKTPTKMDFSRVEGSRQTREFDFLNRSAVPSFPKEVEEKTIQMVDPPAPHVATPLPPLLLWHFLLSNIVSDVAPVQGFTNRGALHLGEELWA